MEIIREGRFNSIQIHLVEKRTKDSDSEAKRAKKEQKPNNPTDLRETCCDHV